ncbi:MAG: hypothetical protein LUF80_06640 [Oscillospiraceae bacterium]|nr:hypothetical protein [Oscillospiraceae bacterium]
MKSYLISLFISQKYLLLFITAALGYLLGKIKIKHFSLGSAGGIFAGIVVGWLTTFIAVQTLGTDNTLVAAMTSTSGSGAAPSGMSMFFLVLFIAAVGLGVGGKIKTVFNAIGVKLIVVGILIPIVTMAVTLGCMQVAPTLMGEAYNSNVMAGMYSGAMTNSAAYGASGELISGMENVADRYASLSDENKSKVLALIGEEDTTATDTLTDEQVTNYKSAANAQLAQGYAIGFPVGTVIILLAMSLMGGACRKQLEEEKKTAKNAPAQSVKKGGSDPMSKPMFYNAAIFGLVIFVGYLIGNIKVTVAGASFSLTTVGGVLISALIFSNFTKIGPLDLTVNPKALGFVREFALLFYMSLMGLQYGYAVIANLSGYSLYIVLFAAVVELVAILVALVLGRFIFRLRWGLLAGAICGGCTSSVGMGAAMSTMDSDEPIVGYGVSQPFAILCNVVMIVIFHANFLV